MCLRNLFFGSPVPLVGQLFPRAHARRIYATNPAEDALLALRRLRERVYKPSRSEVVWLRSIVRTVSSSRTDRSENSRAWWFFLSGN
jgi:hypothetical protein